MKEKQQERLQEYKTVLIESKVMKAEVVNEIIDMELFNSQIGIKGQENQISEKKNAKLVEKVEEDNLIEEGQINCGKQKEIPSQQRNCKKGIRDLLVEFIELGRGIAKILETTKISDLIGNCNPLRQKQELQQEQESNPIQSNIVRVLQTESDALILDLSSDNLDLYKSIKFIIKQIFYSK